MAKRVSRKEASKSLHGKSRAGRGRTIADLCDAMERIAPTWSAADWDNVGLLVGTGEWPLRRLLLSIDLMPGVLDEAIAGGFDAIISYHPPIFRGLKRFRPGRSSPEGVAAAALSNRIAVYSPHTALDAAPGGTNDTLARIVGIPISAPFSAASDPVSQCKFVVFVPAEHVDAVANAIFDAGGGRIGDYTHCSYRIAGEGTFFGTESTNPVVGRRGRVERVAEMRLEVIFPHARLKDVISAVRRTHPYEEPAFDVYRLESVLAGPIGQGRMGTLATPIQVGALARNIARRVAASGVEIVGDTTMIVRRGFVCVGAAGALPLEIPGVKLGGGDVIITGEIRHHDALRYLGAGASAIALGHWASERPVLGPLCVRLRAMLHGTTCVVSRRDRNPFTLIKRT